MVSIVCLDHCSVHTPLSPWTEKSTREYAERTSKSESWWKYWRPRVGGLALRICMVLEGLIWMNLSTVSIPMTWAVGKMADIWKEAIHKGECKRYPS